LGTSYNLLYRRRAYEWDLPDFEILHVELWVRNAFDEWKIFHGLDTTTRSSFRG
jgi:hypothetical protein